MFRYFELAESRRMGLTSDIRQVSSSLYFGQVALNALFRSRPRRPSQTETGLVLPVSDVIVRSILVKQFPQTAPLCVERYSAISSVMTSFFLRPPSSSITVTLNRFPNSSGTVMVVVTMKAALVGGPLWDELGVFFLWLACVHNRVKGYGKPSN